MNETCWDLCVGNPSSSLSSREANCLGNCVDRSARNTILKKHFTVLFDKMKPMKVVAT